MLLRELEVGRRFEFVDKATHIYSAVSGDTYHTARTFRLIRRAENGYPVLLC
jgi:hypothetical protein